MNRWRETRGRKPDTSAEAVFVRYRNGLESKAAYSVATTRWSHLANDPWDVVAYRVPEEEQGREAA